jgi:predicted dehydrogenase
MACATPWTSRAALAAEREKEGASVTATVALLGLAHPHAALYLQTLDALDAVGQIVLFDQDADLARHVAAQWPKTISIYHDLDSLLRDATVTHALVTVPTDQSVPLLTRLVETDRHIFTEKPVARSAAELVPLLDALARHPVTCMVAYLGRRRAVTRQLRDFYRAGAIGRLLSVELRMITTQVRFRDPGHWLFQRERAGGGILAWLGCHLLDMVRYVTQEEITQVAALLAVTNDEPITVEDTAAISFRLTGGAIGSFHAGYLLSSGAAGYEGTSYDRLLVLRGTHGTLTYQPLNGAEDSLVLESIVPPWQIESPQRFVFTAPPARGYGGENGQASLRAFLQPPPHDDALAGAVDALRVLETLDAIAEADRAGRTVVVTHRAV